MNNFLKKIFNFSVKEEDEVQKQEVNLALDDLFVHNFVEKGGKFLYCINKKEVINNLNKIIQENNWNEIFLLNRNLDTFIDPHQTKILKSYNESTPIFTICEHLVAENGDIMFSSNQLLSTKINEFPENFIVFATTSQLVKDTGQGLTGIKTNNKGKLPTNISSVKNYNVNKTDDNFLNYGYSNSKNLYLLLLEDL